MQARSLKSLTQMAASYPAISYNSLRWDIHNRKKKLVDDGILLRSGRKWLIDEERYFADMEEQARVAAA